jgi:hypothetical protein
MGSIRGLKGLTVTAPPRIPTCTLGTPPPVQGLFVILKLRDYPFDKPEGERITPLRAQ